MTRTLCLERSELQIHKRTKIIRVCMTNTYLWSTTSIYIIYKPRIELKASCSVDLLQRRHMNTPQEAPRPSDNNISAITQHPSHLDTWCSPKVVENLYRALVQLLSNSLSISTDQYGYIRTLEPFHNLVTSTHSCKSSWIWHIVI